MSGERLQHAILLIQQRRYSDAEHAIREHLNGEPSDAFALFILAESLYAQQKLADAKSAARAALGSSPSFADAHGLLSRIALREENQREAMVHAKRAVELDPEDSGHHALLASVHLQRKEYELALEATERGLAIDAEDLSCLNLRAEALSRLDRKEEADRTIDKSLNLDPENPYTHANTGWAMLRSRRHAQALEHFREALRRDPMNEYAKAGLVEALKARYWLYRIFLRYSLWVSNLPSRTQWFLILGLYFGNRLLRGLAISNPALAPFIDPLLAVYFVFAISTWVMSPLSNLLLRLNRFGRYALDRNEITTSNFVGASLLLALIGGIGWAITGLNGMLGLGLFGFLMMLPLSSMITLGRKARVPLISATVALGLLGALGVAMSFAVNVVVSGVLLLFIIGVFAYQWLANYFASRV